MPKDTVFVGDTINLVFLTDKKNQGFWKKFGRLSKKNSINKGYPPRRYVFFKLTGGCYWLDCPKSGCVHRINQEHAAPQWNVCLSTGWGYTPTRPFVRGSRGFFSACWRRRSITRALPSYRWWGRRGRTRDITTIHHIAHSCFEEIRSLYKAPCAMPGYLMPGHQCHRWNHHVALVC